MKSYYCRTDLPLTLELAAVPRLADSWVQELQERAEFLRSMKSEAILTFPASA